MNKQLKTAFGVLALALAGQVSAATTWTVGSSASVVAGSGGSTVTSTSTGWADTGVRSTSSSSSPRKLESQTMSTYTNSLGEVGLAITNNDACGSSPCDAGEVNQPEHALDNNGRYEMVLLSFSSAVQLTQMKMSWTDPSQDSDVTVMAYTGAGAPAALTGKTWTTGSLTGWAVIGNYADVGTSTKSINKDGTLSSYWLIGAYNPLGGGNSDSTVNSGNDYVKLTSVSGCTGLTGCNPPTTGQVPEPGSLALLGIGLLGLIRMRKAKQA